MWCDWGGMLIILHFRTTSLVVHYWLVGYTKLSLNWCRFHFGRSNCRHAVITNGRKLKSHKGEMTCTGIIFIPSFMKILHTDRKLLGRADVWTEGHHDFERPHRRQKLMMKLQYTMSTMTLNYSIQQNMHCHVTLHCKHSFMWPTGVFVKLELITKDRGKVALMHKEVGWMRN